MHSIIATDTITTPTSFFLCDERYHALLAASAQFGSHCFVRYTPTDQGLTLWVISETFKVKKSHLPLWTPQRISRLLKPETNLKLGELIYMSGGKALTGKLTIIFEDDIAKELAAHLIQLHTRSLAFEDSASEFLLKVARDLEEMLPTGGSEIEGSFDLTPLMTEDLPIYQSEADRSKTGLLVM